MSSVVRTGAIGGSCAIARKFKVGGQVAIGVEQRGADNGGVMLELLEIKKKA